mgnify:CR=1 FL=1
MKHILVSFCFILTIHASPDSNDFSVNNVLSYIEENFKIDQLYSRAQLLMNNGSNSNPQMVWKLLGLKYYTKGFLARNDGIEPKLHFFNSNVDNHKFKCYLEDNSIKYCEITFSKLVLVSKTRVIEQINNLNSMLSHSEFCVAKAEKNKAELFINTLCKGAKGNLGISVNYKPGQSKSAVVKLKLIPKG